MTPILGTGLKGLVGSRFVELLSSTYSFENLDVSDPENPVDITQYQSVLNRFSASTAEWVVHFAAFTNVSAAWEQRGQETGLAYQINVEGTRNIVKAAQATGKRLIHISTAYVFDGQKSELYTEVDQIKPIEWYGETKAKAEQVVQDSSLDWTILRIDQPFKAQPFAKSDLAHTILSKLQTDSLYPMFTDHFFGPTFIDDFAKILEWVIRTNQTGLWHATSGERWSDFEFATAIQEQHQPDSKVLPGKLDDYLKSLNRPYQRNTALSIEKLLSKLDFSLTPITTALSQLT